MAGQAKPMRASRISAGARTEGSEHEWDRHPLTPFRALSGASLPWLVNDALVRSPEDFWTLKFLAPTCQEFRNLRMSLSFIMPAYPAASCGECACNRFQGSDRAGCRSTGGHPWGLPGMRAMAYRIATSELAGGKGERKWKALDLSYGKNGRLIIRILLQAR